ncbi:hypothetical protein ASE93_01250 [Serratia sp. Leaf50]|nr:hypothetical protein ASE93_01250 [Serratia sp. Leaf50]
MTINVNVRPLGFQQFKLATVDNSITVVEPEDSLARSESAYLNKFCSSNIDRAMIQFDNSNQGHDKVSREIQAHCLQQNLAGLDAQLNFVEAYNNVDFMAEEITLKKQFSEQLKNALGPNNLGLISSATAKDKPLAEQVSDGIVDIKSNYYDVFEGALSKYIEFYKKFSNIISEMGKWVEKKGDNGNLVFKFGELEKVLKKLLTDYTPADGKTNQLYPIDHTKNVSRAEAEKWAKDMGLPASSVIPGSYVSIDTAPVKKMLESLLDKQEIDEDGKVVNTGNNKEITNTQYQAWLAGFNAQEEQIKTTVQSLTGRYSNANSVYDNMIKVLSSTISTLADMAKRFFSF